MTRNLPSIPSSWELCLTDAEEEFSGPGGGASDDDENAEDEGVQEQPLEVCPLQVLGSITRTTCRIIIAMADKQHVW